MKYMLMMHAPKEGWTTAGIGTWAPKDIQAHVAFMLDLNEKLKAAGEFVDGQGLAGPEDAKSVRARKDGTPDTDGPFAEAKEFLAGFWIVDVDSTQRAYDIAATISAAPGKGGAPLYMPVEVRQVMSAPPTEQRRARVPKSSISCARWRRRCSAPSSAASAISRPPKMPCRKRCSPRRRNGRAKACPNIRARG